MSYKTFLFRINECLDEGNSQRVIDLIAEIADSTGDVKMKFAMIGTAVRVLKLLQK